jgi:hypothetical protein
MKPLEPRLGQVAMQVPGLRPSEAVADGPVAGILVAVVAAAAVENPCRQAGAQDRDSRWRGEPLVAVVAAGDQRVSLGDQDVIQE